MTTEPLDIIPLWGLFVGACAILGLAMEGGYRIGRWRHQRAAEEREAPVGAMVASILGLLALVLAFTFNLAASRFDTRRMTVLEEANAIGTAYLRARLLPEPQRTSITGLFREYVAVRLRGVRQNTVREAAARSEELHELLWTQAMEAVNANPNSLTTALFIQSLNQVIDTHGKRVLVGMRNRIPLVIWAGLAGLAFLGIFSVGYQAGIAATRRSPAMTGLVLAFVFVMYLIADLDRGQEGFFQVSQGALLDLQRTMQAQSLSPNPTGHDDLREGTPIP